MKTIKVNTATSYEVKIGSGLLSTLSQELSKVISGKRVAIISDSNVWPLYGEAVETQLQNSDYFTCSYVIPAGEASKNAENYLAILSFLVENQISRSDCILALGGGVVGDLAGFTAATYLRGIPYIQVPTTLLAAVDSSVGGKTAIDLPTGKNLVGAFYQPRLVLCDVDTLNSLPEEIFRDGCAEVIKYGVLFDEKLFQNLMESGLSFDREAVIAQCVEWKNKTVTADEFDKGCRMLLNLGHTVGHGIEACSHYTVSHGQAVAIGMAIVARCSAKSGICSDATAEAILKILGVFGLPTTTTFSAEELTAVALSDKKRSGDTLSLIVPEKNGKCKILSTPVDKLKAIIEAGL